MSDEPRDPTPDELRELYPSGAPRDLSAEDPNFDQATYDRLISEGRTEEYAKSEAVHMATLRTTYRHSRSRGFMR